MMTPHAKSAKDAKGRDFTAPKGRNSSAQGAALGVWCKLVFSPEGAEPFVTPFQGLEIILEIRPGLCPGLTNDALSALMVRSRFTPLRPSRTLREAILS